jgi:aquaporin Z
MRQEWIAHAVAQASSREISMLIRKLAAELLGTALLVFFAVGTATLAFGFQLHGGSIAAGIVMTSLAFGLVLLALAYAIGPVSGCHVNPAVTLGFVVADRMTLKEAAGYWAAQLIGGIAGAIALWAVFSNAGAYDRAVTGLGADGWGVHSMIGLSAGGAFLAEVVLTFVFVLIVLLATRHATTAGFAGLAVGAGLLVVHLVGIPLTGTSVNPARSLGPALVVGGDALKQLWLFIAAPLVGGALAAVCSRFLVPSQPPATAGRAPAR